MDRRLRGRVLLTLVGVVAAVAFAVEPAATATPMLERAGELGMLTDVSCPTLSVCYATAEVNGAGGGTVIGTTDGGHSWEPLGALSGAGLLSGVTCPARGHCEVVGSGNGDAGAVYGTRDGGRRWRVQPAVIGGGFFLAVACPSRRICEATGNSGVIFGTVDGGKKWSQQTVPKIAQLIEGVACPTTSICEAVGYGGGGLALRSVDGGANWTLQTLPRSVQFLSRVACPTVEVCMAVGIDTVDAGRRQVALVVTTSNGGRTWKRHRVPAGYTDLAGVACPTARLCEAVGLGPTAALGTTDGGVTWSAQPIPGSMYMLGVACPSRQTCEAVGQDNNGDVTVFGTVDGGKAWTQQPVSTA